MSRVNRSQISEPTKCSTQQLSTSPPPQQLSSSTFYSVSPSQNSPTLGTSPNEAMQRRGSQCNPMFKPNELLQGYNDNDVNMLRPLLMYNLENIQTYRADCRYKRSKQN